jgi:hypothetical protein
MDEVFAAAQARLLDQIAPSTTQQKQLSCIAEL